MQKAWVNGKPATTISVFDRGLMYGQSVFETICVVAQKPLLLDNHLKRLQKGCEAISVPVDYERLSKEISEACSSLPNERLVLRASVTMGEGGRGYQNPNKPSPNHILSVHDYPDYPASHWTQGVNIGVVELQLSQQPLLAGIKHSNRLEQTISRSQWHKDWQEALVLNQQGQVIEATQSNIFLVVGQRLKTPDLGQAGVAGVMREFILAQANNLDLAPVITNLTMQDIYAADEVFLSNSVIGLWPVRQCQDHRFPSISSSQQLQLICQKHELIPNF